MSRGRQCPLNIVEGLNHFVSDRLRKTPVVIPTTLAGGLDPVAVPNRLRVMEVLSLAITISGSDEE
jgi:hypothetical protein